MACDLTLVIDIGKSNAKLLMVASSGAVVEQHSQRNAPVLSPLGYLALDVDGLALWLCNTLASSLNTKHCTHAIATTHGAALVALDANGVAWPPIDYEFEGCMPAGSPLWAAYQRECDSFADTLSPDLPLGLNAARQLYWLQLTHPAAWKKARALLPYPQYWAWWLCGLASTELSSLGCHTQLWRPASANYSQLAQARGWARLFAPTRSAWEVLGPVRADLGRSLGLPSDCQVHVGVHDSNACLARYLRDAHNTILVSTGTWCVVMMPDGSCDHLDPSKDQLANVSVMGSAVPTARFMSGRLFEQLSAENGATHAAQACARTTSQLVRDLASAPINARLLMVEGPLAANNTYMATLADQLPECTVTASTDPLEGTARGAWMLAHWKSKV
jgi:sugar (pentulose or hexulose) kinase